jgi:hypothetical protein
MKTLSAALIAVFLCLPVYAQDDPDVVQYLRHDAAHGWVRYLQLDAACLADAGQPVASDVILAPSKDRDDWEQMLILSGLHCLIRLQREGNQLQMDLLDALTAE